MDNNSENKFIGKSEIKYFILLLIGSIRFFFCTVFYFIYKSNLFDIFAKLIRFYQTFEKFMLPTILCAFLPLIFVERDKSYGIDNQKRFAVCTIVWVVATIVQIKFVQIGF